MQARAEHGVRESEARGDLSANSPTGPASVTGTSAANRSMQAKPVAMLLAAGLGERMRPLTEKTPKPLLPAGGKPLIVWQIERLRAAGFTALVINHAHLGHQIEQALGDGSSYGVTIRYSAEGEPLETAGGIAKALPLLGEGPFVVTNADIYTDFDYARLHGILTAMAKAPDWLAHLVLVDNPPHHPTGDFLLREDRVYNLSPFHPSRHTPHAVPLTFAGIACYRRELFQDMKPGQKAKLAPLLKAAIDAGRVTGEHHRGTWLDIGTPERLKRLEASLRKHHAQS